MIKVVYLIGIIYNGGVGPSGVLSKIFTYSTMEQCETQLPFMKRTMDEEFPYFPKYIDCIEVEIPGISL